MARSLPLVVLFAMAVTAWLSQLIGMALCANPIDSEMFLTATAACLVSRSAMKFALHAEMATMRLMAETANTGSL